MSAISNIASFLALDRAFNILLDQQVIDDSGPGNIRTITVTTVAANQFVAKQKLRLFVAMLRPKRRITSMQFQEISRGILLKTYSITFELKFLGQKITGSKENGQ